MNKDFGINQPHLCCYPIDYDSKLVDLCFVSVSITVCNFPQFHCSVYKTQISIIQANGFLDTSCTYKLPNLMTAKNVCNFEGFDPLRPCKIQNITDFAAAEAANFVNIDTYRNLASSQLCGPPPSYFYNFCRGYDVLSYDINIFSLMEKSKSDRQCTI